MCPTCQERNRNCLWHAMFATSFARRSLHLILTSLQLPGCVFWSKVYGVYSLFQTNLENQRKVLKQKVLLSRVFVWGSFLAAAEGVRIRSCEEQVRRRRTSPRAAHQHFGESLGEVPWANSGSGCVFNTVIRVLTLSVTMVCHTMSSHIWVLVPFPSRVVFFYSTMQAKF